MSRIDPDNRAALLPDGFALENNRYVITQAIDMGGQGALYKGRDTLFGRNVALKVVLPWKAGHRDFAARLAFEAQVVSILKHPNTTRVYHVGDLIEPHNGKLCKYVVMEWLDGANLREHLAEHGPLDTGRIIALMKESLAALAEAHDEGVVHRDLKPANLFLASARDTERLCILDFGIAWVKRWSGTSQTPRSGQQRLRRAHFTPIDGFKPRGTVPYIPPEAWEQNTDPTFAWDTFVMGLIIAEMILGRPLVQAPNEGVLGSRYKVGDLKQGVALPESLREHPLGPLLEHALAIAPQARYDHARQMRDALLEIDARLMRERYSNSSFPAHGEGHGQEQHPDLQQLRTEYSRNKRKLRRAPDDRLLMDELEAQARGLDMLQDLAEELEDLAEELLQAPLFDRAGRIFDRLELLPDAARCFARACQLHFAPEFLDWFQARLTPARLLGILGQLLDSATDDDVRSLYKHRLGLTLHRQGDLQGALKHLIEALFTSPHLPQPLEEIEAILTRRQDWEALERIYRRIITDPLRIEQAALIRRRADLLSNHLDESDTALPLWSWLWERCREPLAAEHLARHHQARGKIDEALDLLIALSDHPETQSPERVLVEIGRMFKERRQRPPAPTPHVWSGSDITLTGAEPLHALLAQAPSQKTWSRLYQLFEHLISPQARERSVEEACRQLRLERDAWRDACRWVPGPWLGALLHREAHPFAALLDAAGLRTAGLRSLSQVWLPPGTFLMGALPEEDVPQDLEPPRTVTLTRSFLIDRTPVTQRRWQQVCQESQGPRPDPSGFKGDERPVEKVSWYEALAFCNAVSELEGLEPCYLTPVGDLYTWKSAHSQTRALFKGLDCPGWRLPTEAEWEYACRAGKTGGRHDSLGDSAWFSANSAGQTHPVGMKAPNAWGLYDTLGNVWEWCWDGYEDLAQGDASDPIVTPMDHRYRLLRGGSWYDPPRRVLAPRRANFEPGHRHDNLGLRLVRSDP